MRDILLAGRDVSRETLDKLRAYQNLVERWNPTINLVSTATLEDFWERHIVDSIQLLGGFEPGLNWLDIGSGGGLPGIVIAAILHEQSPKTEVVLVESDVRKCVFLRRAISELDLNTKVQSVRIEKLAHQAANVVSARALAPLEKLLEYAHTQLDDGGVAVFPKGRTWKQEVDRAKEAWHFDLTASPSVTDSDASILKFRNIRAA